MKMMIRSFLGLLLNTAAIVLAIFFALNATVAQAQISASERALLQTLFITTNGAGWTHSTHWNDPPGNECMWFGVTCDGAQTTVIGLNLQGNNLTGSLPSGPIDLSNLTNLTAFNASYNALAGSLPALPPSLKQFNVSNNALTGPLNALNGLANLDTVDVSSNGFTGPPFSVAGMPNLKYLYLQDNALSGPMPDFSGAPLLFFIHLGHNQLTGPVSSLIGLAQLVFFFVNYNQLTGNLGPLTGLQKLAYYVVDHNLLTGDAPTPPSPTSLFPGASNLCPNFLVRAPNPLWDTYTGQMPWFQNCTAPPAQQSAASRRTQGTAGTFDLPLP